MSAILKLIEASPHGAIAFYNTADFRREHGYRKPHELKQELDALKHQGYVVMMGEGFLDATYRWAHKGNWDHNWMPDKVVILPRPLFDATREGLRRGWSGLRLEHLNVGVFANLSSLQWLNQKPEGGGSRPRIVGQYLESMRTAKRSR